MRPSEASRAESELPPASLPAGDRASPIAAQADQPGLASRAGPDVPGRHQPDGSRSLAERLARLPDAHPSAWSAAAQPAAARSFTDWASARTGGDSASSGDAWWRGESDIWWRVRSAGEADYDDDIGGLDDPGELADTDDLADADGPAEADWAADADATGETDGQGGGTGGRGSRAGRRTPGAAGPDHGPRSGRWGGAGGAGPDQSGQGGGPYRPWFSADASGDPWFAAGLERWADS